MIEINNLTKTKINHRNLKEIANKVFKKENKKNFDLSIAFVSPAKIKSLNKKYRGKNQATDALSFLYKNHQAGEIAVCLNEVKKNVKKFHSTFNKEIVKVLIHSILHLLGEDHEKSKKKSKRMKEKEEYYLSQIKI